MIGSCHTHKPYGITKWLVLVSLESQLQKSWQAGEWSMVAMFGVLVVLAAASVAVLAQLEP